jgi:tRNA-modifying protein YgfZ
LHRSDTSGDTLVNEPWHQFLQRQGAVTDGDTLRFGAAPEENSLAAATDVVIATASRSLIRARGPDAVTFLHGQFSNDVCALNAAHSQLASYNNPQGRMYAVLRLNRRGDDVLLRLPTAMAADILRRLRMYVLRSKVTLESADVELVMFGVSGPNAVAAIERVLGNAPTEIDGVVTAETATITRVPGPYPRFEITLPPAAAETAWERLRSGCVPVGDEVADWLDISAAVPTITPATSEAFVPQMANLDLLNGISFTKGCYPGQEIVARMQYLGKLKQRLYRVHAACDVRPQSGEPVFSAAFGDQPAGTVVSASPAPTGGYDMLSVIQVSVSSAEVRLGSPDGPILSYLPMPYPIPVEQ